MADDNRFHAANSYWAQASPALRLPLASARRRRSGANAASRCRGKAGAARAADLSRAHRDRSGVHLGRGRYDHPGRRAHALGHRLRRRRLRGSPARQRLGRRRQDVPPAGRSGRPSPNTAINYRSRRASSSPPASPPPTTGRASLHGKDFDRLAAKDREQALKDLEQGKAQLRRFRRQAVLRGAAQHHHGGLLCRSDLRRQQEQGVVEDGRLPGLPAVYANLIEEYRDKRYLVEPQSIADFS